MTIEHTTLITLALLLAALCVASVVESRGV